MKAAMLYRRLDDGKVRCYLCHHHCRISSAGFGICGMRRNHEGTLYTHAYGKVVAADIDLIEKKPLYHFRSGDCLHPGNGRRPGLFLSGKPVGKIHRFALSPLPANGRTPPGTSGQDGVDAAGLLSAMQRPHCGGLENRVRFQIPRDLQGEPAGND